MKPLLVRGMRGLGDNLYQRGFVAGLVARGDEVVVDTPWPQLYADLGVRCCYTPTSLRTQAQNATAQPPGTFIAAPADARVIRVGYSAQDLRSGSIPQAMRRQFGVEPIWSMPHVPMPPQINPWTRFAVIRPVTVRSEWRNEARNPAPEYLASAAEELRQRGYTVVSVASLEDGAEWLVGPEPYADVKLHRGELDVLGLISLLDHAQLTVGGVGWVVPACASFELPLFVVQGGHGGHNAPERLLDHSLHARQIGWAQPQPYCRCIDMKHRCAKHIPQFLPQFQRWLDDLQPA